MGWESKKPGYDGLIEVANRLMMKGTTNSDTIEATVIFSFKISITCNNNNISLQKCSLQTKIMVSKGLYSSPLMQCTFRLHYLSLSTDLNFVWLSVYEKLWKQIIKLFIRCFQLIFISSLESLWKQLIFYTKTI